MFYPINNLISKPYFTYAEIHYRVPRVLSLIKRKQPEIIFDCPSRLEPGFDLPVSCIIKDAHLYPITLKHISIRTHGGISLYEKDYDMTVTDLITVISCQIPIRKLRGYRSFPLDIIPEAQIEINGRQKRIRIHNYFQLSHRPLSVFIADHRLPGYQCYVWTDCHTHSFYTHDQVEFGAPVVALEHTARAMGLNALAVTDHSYDLDDVPGEYVKPDVHLTRWKSLGRDIEKSQNDVLLIRGEEISCRGDNHKNVHFLVYGHNKFIPGNADSAETGFFKKSDLSYHDIIKSLPKEIPAYAAHPGEKPPPGQKLLLNRGFWDMEKAHDVHGFQLFNGFVDQAIRNAFKKWTQILLTGRRQFIIAGNDSHGNFNRVREVKIPNLILHESNKQILGRHRTGLLHAGNREEFLKSLREGRCIVSSGYSIELNIFNEKNRHIAEIGDNIAASRILVRLRVFSSAEFGPVRRIRLYSGNLETGREKLIFSKTGLRYEFETDIPMNVNVSLYLRAEAVDKVKWKHFAFTNPIWIHPASK